MMITRDAAPAPTTAAAAGDALAGARARVDAALDQLAAATGEHVGSLADPLEAAAWARRAVARIAAVRLAVLGEADRRGAARKVGALGTAAWLSGQGVAPGVARREVALAGKLAQDGHSATRDALASGELSTEQALVITNAVDALSEEVTADQRARFEAGLLARARSQGPRGLEIQARKAAARIDPTGSGNLARQEKITRSQREFFMTRRDGMYILGGRLDPEGATHLSAALDPLSAPRPTSVDGADPRSHSRRMGDALVDLARRQLAAGDLPDTGGLPTQVIVTMTLDQLQESLDGEAEAGSKVEVGAAEIVGGTVREPISAPRARRLACDARILPSVMNGNSVILDHGASRRTASPAQRIALALRDQGCTAPFCDRPATWCEAHHLVPWLVSKKTNLNNLALVCDRPPRPAPPRRLDHHPRTPQSHLAPTTHTHTTTRTPRPPTRRRTTVTRAEEDGSMGDRWGAAGPPEEAYSRVSDPERYRELHAIGHALLEELERDFEVTRESVVEADRYDGSDVQVVRLLPTAPKASSLAVVFDTFPGLRLRLGREDEAHVPECGCDACDESVADCTLRLRQYAQAVTAGSFGERQVGGSHERWYEADDASWSSRTPLDRAQQAELRAALKGDELTWSPWTRHVSPS